MTWITELQSDLIITTGDGNTYRPDWLNASYQKSFNVSEFNYPNIAGTDVERRLPRARRFNLEIYFQGENHLQNSDAFEISTEDPRPWTVEHPFYGTLLVQPSTLTFDRTQLNITKVTGTLIETINEDGVKSEIAPVDEILQNAELTNQAAAENMELVEVSASDVVAFSESNQSAFDNLKKDVGTNNQLNALTNAYNEANAAIITATQEPVIALLSAQSVLTAPARWELSIESRLNALRTVFENTINTALSYTNDSQKRYFEGQSVALMTSFCSVAVTPEPTDYDTREDVADVIEDVSTLYDQLLTTFDTISSQTYNPDRTVIQSLNSLVNQTLGQLFDIALDAKQERIFNLQDDTNLINLTHRLLGLDANDQNIQEIQNINNLSFDELIEIKKGREIRYFVG